MDDLAISNMKYNNVVFYMQLVFLSRTNIARRIGVVILF